VNRQTGAGWVVAATGGWLVVASVVALIARSRVYVTADE
jgi:hypothetical protein